AWRTGSMCHCPAAGPPDEDMSMERTFKAPAGFDWRSAELNALFGLLAAARANGPIETTYHQDDDSLIFWVGVCPRGIVFFTGAEHVAALINKTDYLPQAKREPPLKEIENMNLTQAETDLLEIVRRHLGED